MTNKKYICSYCGAEFDSPYKLGGHKAHCSKNPNFSIEKLKDAMSHARLSIDYNRLRTRGKKEKCPYCEQYFSIYGLKNHMKLCSCNSDKDLSKVSPICLPGHLSWNKGLTKNTDERVRKNGESIHNSYEEGNYKIWCDGLTKNTDNRINNYSIKISNTVSSKIIDDNWHTSNSIEKIIYNNISFDSSWEVLFYKKMIEHNIEVIRCKESFEYTYCGNVHKYFPDFYLPQFDLYIEIKGYSLEKDYEKWSLFPFDKKLNIYFSNELNKILNISEIKVCSPRKDNLNKKYLPDNYRNNYVKLFD